LYVGTPNKIDQNTARDKRRECISTRKTIRFERFHQWFAGSRTLKDLLGSLRYGGTYESNDRDMQADYVLFPHKVMNHNQTICRDQKLSGTEKVKNLINRTNEFAE